MYIYVYRNGLWTEVMHMYSVHVHVGMDCGLRLHCFPIQLKVPDITYTYGMKYWQRIIWWIGGCVRQIKFHQ